MRNNRIDFARMFVAVVLAICFSAGGFIASAHRNKRVEEMIEFNGPYTDSLFFTTPGYIRQSLDAEGVKSISVTYMCIRHLKVDIDRQRCSLRLNESSFGLTDCIRDTARYEKYIEIVAATCSKLKSESDFRNDSIEIEALEAFEARARYPRRMSVEIVDTTDTVYEKIYMPLALYKVRDPLTGIEYSDGEYLALMLMTAIDRIYGLMRDLYKL